MASYSAEEVAFMFQNETVDKVLSENVLDNIMSKIDSVTSLKREEDNTRDFTPDVDKSCENEINVEPGTDVDFLNETVGQYELLDQTNIESENNDTRDLNAQVNGYYQQKRKSEENWKQNVNKKQRTLGKAYIGKKLDRDSGQWLSIHKSAKQMGNLCIKESCKRKKNLNCSKFDQDQCQKIFDEYWGSGSRDIQETFLQSSVDVKEKDRSTVEVSSRRNFTRIYKLKKDGISLQVCKDMFLA